jgi:hypothetical protein
LPLVEQMKGFAVGLLRAHGSERLLALWHIQRRVRQPAAEEQLQLGATPTF